MATARKPVVISYARFSSAGQAEGSSLARQVEMAEKWAADNALLIDTQHVDPGLSAYDRTNIREGSLGVLLEQVRAGQIPVGSTLIVESFDRLSRAAPVDAFPPFLDIINAGLELVILTTPPKRLNKTLINANMFLLMEALMEMYRANAESSRKSGLVSAAWKRKQLKAIEDGSLMSAKAPHWIDVTVNHDAAKGDKKRRAAELNPERARLALQIVEWAEQGVGNTTIIRRLNENYEPWSQRIARRKGKGTEKVKSNNPPRWEPSYIQKMLTNPALYGAIQIDDELVEDYYPPLIERGRFDLLQAQRSDRATTKNVSRKGKTVTNLFSGLMRCGYCDHSMNVAGYKVRKGRQAGYERKYVACHGARIGATDCKMHPWFLDELEPSLLFWLTQVDYAKLLSTSKKSDLDKERETLATDVAKMDSLKKRIANGQDAILEGALNLVQKVNDMVGELAELEKIVALQRRRVNALASQDDVGGGRMKGVIVLFQALKKTKDEVEQRALREQLSAAIHLVTEKITLFPMGHTKSGTKEERFIDVEFKNGATRRIEPGEC